MEERVTKKAFEKMKEKLQELKSRRQKISKTIGEAREHGDLRENSAYHAAKEEQGLNEMRIRDLEERLAGAVIIAEEDASNSGMIGLNTTFRVKALESEREYEYTLVPEIEADVLEYKISPSSPLGEAVINCRVGDVVEVQAPMGLIKYQITEVK
jgi:transcription elongation factor GreA